MKADGHAQADLGSQGVSEKVLSKRTDARRVIHQCQQETVEERPSPFHIILQIIRVHEQCMCQILACYACSLLLLVGIATSSNAKQHSRPCHEQDRPLATLTCRVIIKVEGHKVIKKLGGTSSTSQKKAWLQCPLHGWCVTNTA